MSQAKDRTTPAASRPGPAGRRLHPLPVRVMHWINAAVMLVMVGLSLAGVSVSSILLILLSGAAGVAAWLIGRRKEGK